MEEQDNLNQIPIEQRVEEYCEIVLPNGCAVKLGSHLIHVDDLISRALSILEQIKDKPNGFDRSYYG